MVNSNTEYPFPVLRPEPVDYNKSVFNADVIVTPEKDGYNFKTDIYITNNEITSLINNGKAQLGINIQCNSTWLRKIQPVKLGHDEFNLKSSEVHKRVEFCPVVTASEMIENFISSDFSEEFQNLKIIIHPGDPLAIGYDKYFDAEYADDVIRKGDPIISVATRPETAEMEIEYDEDIIMVYVPEKSKQAFSSMKGVPAKYAVMSMLFYLPAITGGIQLLYEDKDQYSSSTWGKTILQSIDQISDGNKNEYQNLLKSPFSTEQKLLGGMDTAIQNLAEWII